MVDNYTSSNKPNHLLLKPYLLGTPLVCYYFIRRKIFLRAPSAPIYTNFEGVACAKKLGFSFELSKKILNICYVQHKKIMVYTTPGWILAIFATLYSKQNVNKAQNLEIWCKASTEIELLKKWMFLLKVIYLILILKVNWQKI